MATAGSLRAPLAEAEAPAEAAEEDVSRPEMLPLMRLLSFFQAFNVSGLLRAGSIFLVE